MSRKRPETRKPETAPKAKAKTAPVKVATEAVPDTPGVVIALARATETKWGVPSWLTVLACWTGSRFHAKPKGTHNYHGIKAKGTMPKNEDGWAWFGHSQYSYFHFGYMCAKELALDYNDPKACIAALKTRCPDIDETDYKLFKEAR